MKKDRFLWSAHRITERQKAGKARSIKGKQLKNSRSTVSKELVEHLSSANVNRCCSILYFLSRKYFASGIFLKISKTIYYQKQIKIQIRNQNNNSVKIQSNLIEECIGEWSICKIEKKQVADANFCRGVSAR